MGFNATRRYRGPATVDIAILVAGVVVLGGLLLWGFLG
jgi:hypothetical protein